MNEPLVSIITPAYNAAQSIEATGRSLIAQTYRNWEWIVADDGSTDATRDLVRGLGDPRIKLLELHHSSLPAVARNRALEAARGELVAFVDADDVWQPEKLAEQLAILERHADAGLVFSRASYFYAEIGRHSARAHPRLDHLPNPGFLFGALCRMNLICTSSVVVRRALLERHGAMSEDPRQRGTEDYELWLRLAPHTRFAWSERALVHYRVDPQTVSGNTVAIAEGAIAAVEKAIAQHPSLSPFTAESFAAWKLFRIGHAQFQSGIEHCGRRALQESLRLDPANRAARLWLVLGYLGPGMTRRLRRLAYRFA